MLDELGSRLYNFQLLLDHSDSFIPEGNHIAFAINLSLHNPASKEFMEFAFHVQIGMLHFLMNCWYPVYPYGNLHHTPDGR